MKTRTGVLLAVAALAAGSYALIPSASAATNLTATFAKTQDWGSGFEAKFTVANGGSSASNNWKIEFDLPSGTTVGSFWDAQVTRNGDRYTATNRDWNAAVGAGSSVAFGFIGAGGGAPTNCTINGNPCAGTGTGNPGDKAAPSAPGGLKATATTADSVTLAWNASTDNVGVVAYDVYKGGDKATTVASPTAIVSGLTADTSYQFSVVARDAAGNASAKSAALTARTAKKAGTTPEPSPEPSPNPNPNPQPSPDPTPDPQPSPAGGRGAPYLFLGWGNPQSATTVMQQTGVKWFTMAFILSSGGCTPSWDGTRPLTGSVDETTIKAIRAAGGDIVPSFGGWSGNKLGPNCSTPEALAGAYQKVIDAYQLKAIDIDIENSDEFENEVVQDRVLSALKIVKQKNPNVQTIVTFGTGTTGPNFWGNRLIERAGALDAKIDVFTIMPFDFGSSNIATDTISAATGLKNKVKSTFGYSDADAYKHIGISGMNGLSDQKELTTAADWTKIRDWSKNNGLGRLAFWAVNRDRGGCDGQVSASCSGIAQADLEFTRITAGF
ncbi:cellulose binding domain-containing protein [Actinosynnema sp.]|uniref:cellulose binding domain-containing protein n=1 Tax=Actinosynnema sp. TaxID=1872144 RepID=UPI003F874838